MVPLVPSSSMGPISRWAALVTISLAACVTQAEAPDSRDAQADRSDGAAADVLDAQPVSLDARADSGQRADAAASDVTADRIDAASGDRCAAREVCNDVDDTCDGVIDEGCPRTVTVTMPAALRDALARRSERKPRAGHRRPRRGPRRILRAKRRGGRQPRGARRAALDGGRHHARPVFVRGAHGRGQRAARLRRLWRSGLSRGLPRRHPS
jgi:hypothetical protein